MPQARKAEMSFLYSMRCLVRFYISIKYNQNIPKGIRVIEWTRNLLQKKKDDNSKIKKGRVVILVCDSSSHPVLHFYQVS